MRNEAFEKWWLNSGLNGFKSDMQKAYEAGCKSGLEEAKGIMKIADYKYSTYEESWEEAEQEISQRIESCG